MVVTGTRTSFPRMLTCATFMLPHDWDLTAEGSALNLHELTYHKRSQYSEVERAEQRGMAAQQVSCTIKGTFVQRLKSQCCTNVQTYYLPLALLWILYDGSDMRRGTAVSSKILARLSQAVNASTQSHPTYAVTAGGQRSLQGMRDHCTGCLCLLLLAAPWITSTAEYTMPCKQCADLLTGSISW